MASTLKDAEENGDNGRADREQSQAGSNDGHSSRRYERQCRVGEAQQQLHDDRTATLFGCTVESKVFFSLPISRGLLGLGCGVFVTDAGPSCFRAVQQTTLEPKKA